MTSGTFTLNTHETDEHGEQDAGSAIAYLVLVMRYTEPAGAPMRVLLTDIAELRVGRGEAALIERIPGSRCVSLQIPDPLMSAVHARLCRDRGRWMLIDAESKNGTQVNGRKVHRHALSDRDWLSIGSSLLLFRDTTVPVGERAATGEVFERGLASTALTTISPVHARTFARLSDVAPSDISVLIRGDTGTGKEVTARAVHELSGRAGEFVAVNCGALPETLIESELFGARKGAFSGASEERQGLVRAAHGGTLFLDEIAELSAPSQVALLRVLQERQVVPVGGTRPVDVDVRFIAATHQDLERRIVDGRFREDLYARVTGFETTLPPLRERLEDLGLLIATILGEAEGERASEVRFSRGVARALVEYEWPRNIRELSNALKSALLVAKGGRIELSHLPSSVQAVLGSGPQAPLDMQHADALRAALLDLLARHHGNVAAVARALGKKRQQVHRWNRQLGIDPNTFRGRGPHQGR